MNLFYTFLPSAAPYVRRVAAEGLALLASLGVTDAHTLQSSILHSLEKLMEGNLPDSLKTIKVRNANESPFLCERECQCVEQ